MKRTNDFVLEIKSNSVTHVQNYHVSNVKMAQIISFYMTEYRTIPYTITAYTNSGKILFSTINPSYESND